MPRHTRNYLIAFHFEKQHIPPNIWIPVAYAIAMGIDGLAAEAR